MLQHNEVMDIQSTPTFVPRGHHLLFAFLLVCLLTCLLAFLFLCLLCLSCLSILCLFHMLFTSFPSIACLLVSCFYLFMYTYGLRMHGARARSPKRKQKGRRRKYVDMPSGMFNRFRGLASPILLCTLLNPPSFLPPFSLRWVVLGISCCVPFVLISKVWQPLFTFLHLYFGSCSKDVGIYFPILCACIMHDVCIYIPARPPSPSGVIVIVHVT